MTAVYATIKHQTLREEFDRYQERISIRGEMIHFDPRGPMADAVWAKENLACAIQTLPDGYCGLPLQQTCSHPNACLPCDNFLTAAEFLPQHREQLQRTEELIARAEAAGRRRLVEMNTPVRANLVRIIEASKPSNQTPVMASDDASHLAAAAARKHQDALERATGAVRDLDAAGRPIRRSRALPASRTSGSSSSHSFELRSSSSAASERPVFRRRSARVRRRCVSAIGRSSTRTRGCGRRTLRSRPSSRSPTVSSAARVSKRSRSRRNRIGPWR